MPPVEKKAPRGRPQKAYSPKEAGVVRSMSQYGVPHEDIAATIGMCVETMQRLYSHELAQGRAVAIIPDTGVVPVKVTVELMISGYLNTAQT